jgi:hypothetical protein
VEVVRAKVPAERKLRVHNGNTREGNPYFLLDNDCTTAGCVAFEILSCESFAAGPGLYREIYSKVRNG